MADAAYEANVAFIEAVERLHTNATKPVTEEHLSVLSEDLRLTRSAFMRLLQAVGKDPDHGSRAGVVFLD